MRRRAARSSCATAQATRRAVRQQRRRQPGPRRPACAGAARRQIACADRSAPIVAMRGARKPARPDRDRPGRHAGDRRRPTAAARARRHVPARHGAVQRAATHRLRVRQGSARMTLPQPRRRSGSASTRRRPSCRHALLLPRSVPASAASTATSTGERRSNSARKPRSPRRRRRPDRRSRPARRGGGNLGGGRPASSARRRSGRAASRAPHRPRQSQPDAVDEPGHDDGPAGCPRRPGGYSAAVERRQRVGPAFEPRDKPGDRAGLRGGS